MNRNVCTSLMIAGILTLTSIPELYAQSTDTDQLKATVKSLDQAIQELKLKVADLEKSNVLAKVEQQPTGHASPVINRNTFSDNQVAAPRPDDLTLDPQYRGFIPIPHTPAMIRFNAKPRVDFIFDTGNPGDPDQFVPAEIPVKGDPDKGGGSRFNVSAKGSRLMLDVRAPTLEGTPRFYFENDFFGSGSSAMNFRVRHLYGQYYNIILGQTFSAFEDPDIWPDTLDYEGPNSVVSARLPLLRYQLPLNKQWQVNASVEKPSSEVDTTGDPTAVPVNRAPDIGLNTRWEKASFGHVQLAAIGRVLGADGETNGNQTVLGGGLSLSVVKSLFTRDSLQLQGTLGQGIARYDNDDFFNNDAAYNQAGDLKALPYMAAMVGYTHGWSEKLRSTASYGLVNINNETLQGPNAYHQTQYASVNLMWQPFKLLTMGVEGLYGHKEVQSGATGADWRIQFGVVYSLF
ncbi:MAG: DcaP family trimeric outer membrane transporter [Kiritimatiellaeota bacterium]|nr:DcaP family trimeric outer membrane transporter [Kiritimatiellota bacterium]